MRLLLVGKNGQVGWELQRSLACLGEVTALGSPRDDGPSVDLAQPDSLREAVRTVKPDAIVNAAAYTAVDRAESEPELAMAINAESPRVLAEEAARIGAALIHFSTDYVFDGSGTDPRSESAATGPLSVYGRSKLAGEEAIRAVGARHLILRTGWVYGAHGANFAKTMLRLAAERERLTVIDDQIGAPTGADLLADVSAHALRAMLDDASLAGTYHCVASGHTSWHGYARFVIEWARTRDRPIKVAPDMIVAVPTSTFPTPASRPLNSRLDTRLLRERFLLSLPNWEYGVERMLREVIQPN